MGKRNEDGLTDKQKRFVAAYTGAARANATEAARIAGYSAKSYGALRVVGHQLLTNPNVAAAIDAAFADFRDDGAAIKRVRLAGKLERLALCWRTIDARAARNRERLGTDDPMVAAAESARRVFGTDVPAEALSGLLVEKETITAQGMRSTEWAVDTGLLKEMRELEDDIAAEVGEAPRVTLLHRHSGKVQHDHRFAGHEELDRLSVEELEDLYALSQKIHSGAVER